MSGIEKTKNAGKLAEAIKSRMEGKGNPRDPIRYPKNSLPELKPLPKGETFSSDDPNAYLRIPEDDA